MSHPQSQNIEQQRAAEALFTLQKYHAKIKHNFEKAEEGGEGSGAGHESGAKDPRAEYLSSVKALPAAILQNGLGQTLASYRAASTDGPQDVYQHLSQWLCSAHSCTPFNKDDQLLEALVTNDQSKYIQVQAETLAYARWLKKLAVAEFPKQLLDETQTAESK